MELLGKVAIVTGSASGIGRATALALAKEGADVALVDINGPGLHTVADEIAALGRKALPLEASIANPDQVRQSVRTTLAEFARIDILVNNATSRYRPEPPIEYQHPGGERNLFNVTLESFDGMMHGFYGSILFIQEVARHMIERGGGGKIVCVSSSSAFRAHAQPVYGAMKAGINALTRMAALQLAPYNINVNAIAPGVTITGAYDREHATADVQAGPLANFFGRPSESEDQANVIVFLCTEQSRQITGQTINVSAGLVV